MVYDDPADIDDIVRSFRVKRKSIDTWRVIIMVHPEDVGELDTTIDRLQKIGLDQIHVCAQTGLRLSKKFDYAKHQEDNWHNPYTMWKESLSNIGNIYTSQSPMFLIIRPGVYVWEQLPTYCEYQIPQNVVGIWCPLKPKRVYPTAERTQPRCTVAVDRAADWGWCPAQADADMEIHHCFVVTGYMLTLMSAYMPFFEEDRHVGSVLAAEMGRKYIPYYFHTPSLATCKDPNYQPNDMVGLSFHMSQADMRDRRHMMIPV